MGEAFAGALIKSDISKPSRIYVSDINMERLNELKSTYGVNTTDNNAELFTKSDVVILAVKPQVIEKGLREIAGNKDNLQLSKRKLVISIAAGIKIKTIESVLYNTIDDSFIKHLPIIRVMPNTPALVLSGISAMCGNRNTIAEDLDIVNEILASMGKVIKVEENEMDAVTALSGSGPAYVFYLAEAMMDAGIALGFDPDTAATLTYTTLKGAVNLLEQQNEPPEVLRRKVTSPGGTTEAALRVLQKNRVKENIIEAIKAAAERSSELSA
ncbi:MAG: pyrroline-5-carboxylate reductase [Deltaproteobacteria bacterium]|nr:pyrroline-5-carboxylate reductase [Deltaproteobacteria bacterium]MBW2218445.1 pyrroline-5-carboxylate reductase [Deltaproteobacteria bacterium]